MRLSPNRAHIITDSTQGLSNGVDCGVGEYNNYKFQEYIGVASVRCLECQDSSFLSRSTKMQVQGYTTQTIVVPPAQGYPFYITANCYTPNTRLYHPHGRTLLLLHSTSFHKEVYEPTLQELLRIAFSQVQGIKIKEILAVECPNHGESATLNRATLALPQYHHYCTSCSGLVL